jgi:hypothetical protein
MVSAFGIHAIWFPFAVFALYVFGAMYVYAPLKIKRQQVKEMQIDFQPVELSQLPPDIVEAVKVASRGLAQSGFIAVGHLTQRIARTGQEAFVSLWINETTRDSAQIIAVRTPTALGAVSIVTLTTFWTEFTDETGIVTSNSSASGAYPSNPLMSVIRIPRAADVASLYRFHRARVERGQAERIPTLDSSREPLRRMWLEHTQTFERLIKLGYYTIDEVNQTYVPTLKGAYLMTYRLLPPFKQIQKWRKDWLADRTLRELGFGGMDAFRRAQSQPAAPISAA